MPSFSNIDDIMMTSLFVCDSAGGGSWSTSDVTTDEVVRGEGGAVQVRCLSTHLTSFAVLVDVTGSGVSLLSIYMQYKSTHIIVKIECLYLHNIIEQPIHMTYI